MAIKFASRLITVSGAALGAYVFLVRPWQRRWGATDEEVLRALPGDELLAHPDVKLTRAVTIRAKPTDIWPWLVQIGQGRGGYYSYDWLENLAGLKMKSTAGINPGVATTRSWGHHSSRTRWQGLQSTGHRACARACNWQYRGSRRGRL